jgi:hypothetical protein
VVTLVAIGFVLMMLWRFKFGALMLVVMAPQLAPGGCCVARGLRHRGVAQREARATVLT